MRSSAFVLIATFFAGHAASATTSPGHLGNLMGSFPDFQLASHLLRDGDHGQQLHKITDGNDDSRDSSSRSSSFDISGSGSDIDEERFFIPEAEMPFLEQVPEQGTWINGETVHHANEVTAHVKEAKEEYEEGQEEEEEEEEEEGEEEESESDSGSDSNSDSDDASSGNVNEPNEHKTHPGQNLHSHPRISDEHTTKRNEDAHDEFETDSKSGSSKSDSNSDSDDLLNENIDDPEEHQKTKMSAHSD